MSALPKAAVIVWDPQDRQDADVVNLSAGNFVMYSYDVTVLVQIAETQCLMRALRRDKEVARCWGQKHAGPQAARDFADFVNAAEHDLATVAAGYAQMQARARVFGAWTFVGALTTASRHVPFGVGTVLACLSAQKKSAQV